MPGREASGSPATPPMSRPRGRGPARWAIFAAAAMSTLTRDNLVSSLQQLQASGGADNRLVVAAGDYYVVVHGRRGAPDLVCEAVTNFYLDGPAALTPARERVLGDRGFRERKGKNNAYREARPTGPDSLARLADDLLGLFALAYGVAEGAPATYELQLGDRDPTANPDLLRAMRMLAVRRDMDARHRVYTLVMSATFLVPTDPGAITVDEPLTVDRLGRFPVIAGFTDIDSLRLWRPTGAPFARIPGARLVPLAVARRVGSLLINPKGNVGGELYINELESIDGALRRREN